MEVSIPPEDVIVPEAYFAASEQSSTVHYLTAVPEKCRKMDTNPGEKANRGLYRSVLADNDLGQFPRKRQVPAIKALYLRHDCMVEQNSHLLSEESS